MGFEEFASAIDRRNREIIENPHMTYTESKALPDDVFAILGQAVCEQQFGKLTRNPRATQSTSTLLFTTNSRNNISPVRSSASESATHNLATDTPKPEKRRRFGKLMDKIKGKAEAITGSKRLLKGIGAVALVASVGIGSMIMSGNNTETAETTRPTPTTSVSTSYTTTSLHEAEEYHSPTNTTPEVKTYSNYEIMDAWIADHPNSDIIEALSNLAKATPEQFAAIYAHETQLARDGFYDNADIWLGDY